MNSADVNSRPVGLNVFDPQNLGDLQDVKSAAIKTLQESFRVVGNFSATGTQSNAQGTGLPDLESPSLSKQVNDLTLRIGLLQDALNQLMQDVSRTEITQRMNELHKENEKELQRFQEQMEKAAEVQEKNTEAEQKGNIFEAVSNWIQAVVSVVSAIITLVSAVGQLITNPVGAAGLIVAGVALIGAAAVQITLAIDATMRAAGQEGFLSEADKTKMAKAVEILGYIALAGSMIGLIGGVVVALGQAGKAAGMLAGKEVSRLAATKLVAAGGKEAVAVAAKAAFKESMKPLMQLSLRMGLVEGIGRGTASIVSGVGNLKVADLKQSASDLQAEADQAEAAAKALQAQIAKIRAIIEQLQEELEALVDDAQQTLAIIFGAIDESAESMTKVMQTQSA
ncbi:type III secretion system translocon subunit SctE [Horticoccus sp. 23ND18S-11]|uniref:type III secretion system translocon subunit SctE n=1 Tax=Horticoccus sp. 23ND18S-11 TaxID=3391832 RepID=UPI0039C8CC51